jgi:hypothetical protein
MELEETGNWFKTSYYKLKIVHLDTRFHHKF